MTRTLAEQLAEMMEYDENLTGLRVFFAAEDDKQVIDEAKEVSDEDLLKDAFRLAQQNFKPTDDGRGEFIAEKSKVFEDVPKNLLDNVSVEKSLERDALRAELIKMEEFDTLKQFPRLKCDVDSVAVDTISPYWSGDRILDEASPELCGHQFMKDQTEKDDEGETHVLSPFQIEDKILFAESPEADTFVPKLNDKDNRMTRLSYYASKRQGILDKLLTQARQALLLRNGKELHRLHGKLFELRDSSFEIHLLISIANAECWKRKMAPFFKRVKKNNKWTWTSKLTLAEQRNLWLSHESTKQTFNDSRCLTQEDLTEGMAFFTQAWKAYKAGRNEIDPVVDQVQPPTPLKINVEEIWKSYNEAKLEELRDFWKLTNSLIANSIYSGKPVPNGTFFLKSEIEEKGVNIKRMLEHG